MPNQSDHDGPDADESPANDGPVPGSAGLQLPRQLRYVCTPEEIEEGGKLAVIESHGGSAWKAIGCTLVLLGATFLLLWFQVAPEHRLWLIAGLVAIFVLVTVFQKLLKRKTFNAPLELEINEGGIRIVAGESSSTFSAASIEKLIESEKLFALKCGQLVVFVPKCVFASDAERDSFRALAAAWCESAGDTDVSGAEVENDSVDDVSVTFRLRFRDYVDRTLVSWRARAVCGGLFLLALGVASYAAFQPAPQAVVSPARTLAIFTGLLILGGTPILYSWVCLEAWINDWSHRHETEAAIGEGGIRFRTPNGDTVLTWSNTTRFKESRRCFYVWWPGTRGWIMIPKRAFASDAEIQQCRALLATHAEESTWFWS